MGAEMGYLTMTEPLVSVLIPVRNEEQYLKTALNSVLTQKGVEFEVICIDDHSVDRTFKILMGAAKGTNNLRVASATGNGVSDALNQAIELSRGKFLARMDADDICLPGRLDSQVRYLDAHPDLGVLGCQGFGIDAEGNLDERIRVPVGVQRVHAALPVSLPLIHPSVMMRREPVTSVGGYRRLFDGAEDYDLWLRLADNGVRIDNMNLTFVVQRHSNKQFWRARQAASALVAYHLRHEHGNHLDSVDNTPNLKALRPLFEALDADDDVRFLTAAFLVDNGGTLRSSGDAYFEIACRGAAAAQSIEPDIRRRLALASVRHQLQLARNGRKLEALWCLGRDLLRWRTMLIEAYWRQLW